MTVHEAVSQTYKNIRKELSRYQAGYGGNEESSLTLPASLTVEASLMLPLFLMIILSFLSLFHIMSFQLQLQSAMDCAVQKAASYYYAVQLAGKNEDAADSINEAASMERELITGGITAAYLRAEIISNMDNKIFERAHIWGGKAGLTFLQSSFPNEKEEIDLVVTYQVEIPFLPGENAWMLMSQRSCRRAWTGSVRWSSNDGETNEEAIVYVTEHGSVYHTDLNCSHLRLNIKSVLPSEIATLRNGSGGKYYLCEKCQDSIAGFYFYITEKGDHYHYKLQCSGLTRKIRPVALSEVSDRSVCSRCKGVN